MPSREIIVKPVSHRDLVHEEALTLRQVRSKFNFRGRGNRPINLETLRRWSNQKRGFKPRGPDGPVLVLPTVLHHGEYLTMPSWVQWFIDESARIRDEQEPPFELEPSARQLHRQAEAAKKRMRKAGLKC